MNYGKEIKKFLEREFTILEILQFISVLCFVLFSLFVMYNQSFQINTLLDHISQLQTQNKQILNQLEVLKRTQLEISTIDKVADISGINNSIDPAVLAAKYDMQKFYITTGLGIFAAVGLIGFGVYYFSGFSFWSYVPASLGKIPYIGKFLVPVKKFCIVDEINQINWLVEIMNNKVCYLYVESLTNTGTKIPVSLYLHDFILNSGNLSGGGAAVSADAAATATTAIATSFATAAATYSGSLVDPSLGIVL